MKMAPLFTRKADSHARQLFLLSGVPDKVKRVLETQASFEEQEAEIFPKESHIQQKDANEWMWNLSAVNLPLKHDCYEEICDDLGSFSLNDVSGCCNMKEQVERIVAISCKGPEMRPVFGLPMDVIKPILRMIKQESPDFKVVNTFKALRTKYREEEFLKAAALSTLAENQRPKRKSSNRKSFDSQSVNSSVSYRARVWTEKYKPSCSTDVIGNSECVSQLKRWLEAWRKASEDATKLGKEDLKQKKKKTDLIDDDFVVSDNSSDSVRNNQPVGVAVLYGPHGCGKTSTVYALANDLGYKVLEVNASEKRNGKLVLSKLSEATQSHQVQQSNTAKQDFAKLFGKSSASKNRKQKHLGPKRVNLEEEKSKKMSLILFEDVDVVFEEEDEGFLSAVNSLLSTSKRPVILTTTDPDSTLISRFMNNSSLILQFSCPSKLLYTWLQIVSILEGVYAAPDTVRDLVFLCKGDFRRALLQMQLWVMSGGNNLAVPSISHSSHNSRKGFQGCDDDNLSDFDDECENIVPSILANPDCVGMLLGKNYDIDGVCASELQVKRAFVKVPYPLNLGLFWWNIPPLLSLRQIKHTQLPVIKEDTATTVTKAMLDDSFMASFCTDDGSTSNTSEDVGLTYSQETSVAISYEPQEVEKHHGVHNAVVTVNPVSRNSCKEEEMNAMAYQMISMSFIDVISFSSCLPGVSSTEPVSRFSQTLLKDSLALVKEDIEGPNFLFHSISEDVSHWLAEQTINNSRALLCDDNLDAQSFYNNCLPNEEEHRWRSLYAKTEHNILSILPPFMLLEHRSIATDYLPVLRTMCRLEKNRNTINTKRRNRFYHYLKSLGANLSAAELELLCRTMIDY